MKILFLTQLFQPEPNHLKGLAFAKELMRRGHEIEVLTGFPNYPGGKIYPGYRMAWRQREVIDGIPILRVPLLPDHSGSGLKRILCYLSLAFSACIPGLFLIKKPDIVHVYQGPATLALPAILLRLLLGVPYVLDIQDLWPDSVLSSGMLKVPLAQAWLNWWCHLTYRFAAKIIVLSPGYKSTLVARGVPAEKIEVVYNWCDESQRPVSDDDSLSKDNFNSASTFRLVYAGNLGKVQALDAVIKAAALIAPHSPAIQFVFIGDGVDGDRLKQTALEAGLSNVTFIPRQPIEKIGTLLDKADVLLLHLRDDPLCRIGIPQKTQAYLAAGKPILIAVNGDAAKLVAEAKAGLSCTPDNPESIAAAVTALFEMSVEERETMGRNGLNFFNRYLAFPVGVERVETILSGALK